MQESAQHDDLLQIIDEEIAPGAAPATRVWRILIVDDDQDVHQATEFALANTFILGRPLQFLHAYSAADAERLLREHPDIAVILLDVVMESDDAGLRLVRTIRETLGIAEARIILRTGQPGYAPEIDAIRDYDINDYKTKSELSRNRLYTTLTTALRSYEQIHTINASRRGLDMIIRASNKLMGSQGSREFSAGIITQISALLGLDPEGVVCVHERDGLPEDTTIIAAAGRYADCVDRPLASLDRPDVVKILRQSLAERRNVHTASAAALFFQGAAGQDMAAYIDTNLPLDDINLRLLEVFCTNIAVNFENVLLFARLNDHAYNDQLLHIPNRLAFIQAVDRIIGGGRADRTLTLVDIDHFSQLNDALGYLHGDALLIAVTCRLRNHLPENCQLARIDADTFGIIGPDAALTPQQLQEIFVAPFEIENAGHTISISIGLVRLTEIDGNGSDALKAANIALNRAKEDTRGQYCYYTREMGADTRCRVKLMQDLRTAFDLDRLFVVYQPQVSLASGAVVGVEALLRWRNDNGSFVPPDQFIPIAESSGLIIALGAWVLRLACNEQRRLLQAGVRDLRMAVNVSVVQFRHPGFLDLVAGIIAETGIAPSHLELEITESVAMLEADFMVDKLLRLKQLGISIAVDDFGTGFSSLSYLERLQVDRLKIDRSFVCQMGKGESSRRIVETIVKLGQTLSLDVIAEGVETEEEAALLRTMGCDEAQGYLYARPLPVSDVLPFLMEKQGRWP